MPIIARDPAHDELWFSARMTNIQFQALAKSRGESYVQAGNRKQKDRRASTEKAR
jgi:hypothetical protein